MRKNYHILLLFITFGVAAGSFPRIRAQQTVHHLDEVRITGSRKADYQTGLHTIRIDSVLKSRYFGSDLARVLQTETNLNILNYGGEGSLSTLRMRGTGSSQTQFTWNGIPVNSPTTGTTDLSLLPAGEADAVEITCGASGSQFGSGTFGGSVNLYNRPDWDNRISALVSAEAGSWRHYQGGVNVKAGTDSFQYHFSGSGLSAANNYRYINAFKTGAPVESRQDDSLRMYSVQQHFFIRLPRNGFLQYGAWYNHRNKQLPDALGTASPIRASQRDISFRQFARFSKWFAKTTVEATAGCFIDSLHYLENPLVGDSVLKSSGLKSVETFLSLSDRWFITPAVTLESAVEAEIESARTGAYAGTVKDHRSSLFLQVRYNHKGLITNASIRQVFFSAAPPRPLFSVAGEYRFPALNLTLRSQVANKFRMPTLNDRYWQPGGNPDLLPESGAGGDLGFDWQMFQAPGSGLTWGSTFFIQDISNWIQWVPAGSYWSPRNIREVVSKGIELEIKGARTFGNVKFRSQAQYSYTEVFDWSDSDRKNHISKQLPYVPAHLVKARASASHRHLEGSLGYSFTGRRSTTDDQDPYFSLDPFHLVDLDLTYAFEPKSGRILVNARISNLTNSHYQLIRAYPTPGRSFYLSVTYLFNQKKKSHASNQTYFDDRAFSRDNDLL